MSPVVIISTSTEINVLDILEGDLVTLKGLSKHEEKPIGIVKKKLTTNGMKYFGLTKI